MTILVPLIPSLQCLNLSTQTISGTLTVNGPPSARITLRCTQNRLNAGQRWYLNAANTSPSYVYASSSIAGGTGAPFICGPGCVDGGGNSNWIFNP